MNSHKIFISYRRDGGDITAKLICEALKNRGYDTFYDYDALKGGVFDAQIRQEIINCSDMILVLPQNALDRCVNDDDWVRQEVALALENRKNIVPVMLRGFEFPEVLPEDIDKVRYYNGVRFYMEFFDAVIDKIEEKFSFTQALPSKSEGQITEADTSYQKKKTDKKPSPTHIKHKQDNSLSTPKTSGIRKFLSVSAILLWAAAAVMLGVSAYSLTYFDIDLVFIWLFAGILTAYVGYVVFIFRGLTPKSKKLDLSAIAAFVLAAIHIICGLLFEIPYLLYCGMPYIIVYTLSGALLLLNKKEDCCFPFKGMVVRRGLFNTLFIVFTIIISAVFFLLLFESYWELFYYL
jgi:hypothetical protein